MVATNANVVAAMGSHVVVVTDSEWLIMLVYSSLQHRMDAAKSLLSGPLLPALKGAPMDIIYHSEIGTPHTMIEIMNYINVRLKLIGRTEYSCSQYNECVTAMNGTPLGEIMCRVHIADQSESAKHQQ